MGRVKSTLWLCRSCLIEPQTSACRTLSVKRDTFCDAREAPREASVPFERGERPFERGERPFERGERPFERGERPFERGERPFERGERPFERGERPFER